MFKVLIVDDEPLVRKGIAKIIDWESLGFVLFGEAEDGAEAYEQIVKEECELCITDIRMPEVDGLELIRRVRNDPRLNVKFVILSAYNDFVYAQTAMKHGVKDYILKPIDEDVLSEVLHRIAGEIRMECHQETGYRQGQDAIAGKTCIRLIRGEIAIEEAERIMDILGLGKSGGYRCILLDTEFDEARVWTDHIAGEADGVMVTADGVERQNVRKQARQVIENVIGKEYERRIFEIESKRTGIIVDQELLKRFHGDIRELVREVYAAMAVDRKMHVSLLVGEAVGDLGLLKDSYKTALHAQSCRFVSGNDTVVHYDDVKDMKFKYAVEDIALFKKLEEAVEAGNEKDIGVNVDFIFHYFHSSLIAPECIKASVINFNVGIAKRISSLHGDMDAVLKKNTRLFNFDLHAMTAVCLKKLFVSFCLECSIQFRMLTKRQPSSMKLKMEEYIKANFREDITLKTTAAEFYLNPAYLGQVFRKTFGMNFHEYLNRMRMEEAKRLLKRTDFKVYEIASMVGYTNADYFSNKFEILMGISPLQYRKSG